MTMLLSTFHQSGKARQEKFWLCYPTQPFSVKQYTLWLLLYLFLHFYFSLSSHLSINWAMTLLAALLVSSCTALKLWFLLFFNKASPRPYAHVFITIIAIFFFADGIYSSIYRTGWSDSAHKLSGHSWRLPCTFPSFETTCKVTSLLLYVSPFTLRFNQEVHFHVDRWWD